uniref:MYND-type domain-containing protein n=1 Tax=Neogobius melanostomus TaxID=47308 RepID=A0A8C6TC49_9GOBI
MPRDQRHPLQEPARLRRQRALRQTQSAVVHSHRVRGFGRTRQQQGLEEEHSIRRETAALPHPGWYPGSSRRLLHLCFMLRRHRSVFEGRGVASVRANHFGRSGASVCPVQKEEERWGSSSHSHKERPACHEEPHSHSRHHIHGDALRTDRHDNGYSEFRACGVGGNICSGYVARGVHQRYSADGVARVSRGPAARPDQGPSGAELSHQGAGLTLEVGSEGGVSPPDNQQVDKNTWVYLEEMANTLLSNAQQLKSLIEQARHGVAIGKELRKECSVLNQSFQSQMGFPHPDDSDARSSSDINEIIMNQMCVNCGRVAMTECNVCHKVNYCSNFCQRKDWKDHQLTCTGAVQDEDQLPTLSIDKIK